MDWTGFYLEESISQQSQNVACIFFLNHLVGYFLIFKLCGSHLVDKLRKIFLEALSKVFLR